MRFVANGASRPPGQSRPEGKTPYVTSAVGIEETEGSQRVRRLTLFTRTVIWVTGLVCAAFLLGSLAQAWTNSQLTQSLQRAQQATQQLQQQHSKLEQQAKHYADPYVIESEARQQQGYTRPGEHVVIVANAQKPNQPQAPSTRKKSSPSNFWQAWWNLFFGNG